MERVPGVALADVWSEMDLETKSRETKVIVGFLRQLRDIRGRFTRIRNLYFLEDIDISNPAVCVVPTEDEKYAIGPIVTPFMFAGGRKLRIRRDLGPYSNDAKYITALTHAELDDMKLLQSPDAQLYSDFDEGRC